MLFNNNNSTTIQQHFIKECKLCEECLLRIRRSTNFCCWSVTAEICRFLLLINKQACTTRSKAFNKSTKQNRFGCKTCKQVYIGKTTSANVVFVVKIWMIRFHEIANQKCHFVVTIDGRVHTPQSLPPYCVLTNIRADFQV